MGKIIETKINNFGKGMESDARGLGFSLLKHFKIDEDSGKLVPVFGTTADTTGQENIGRLLFTNDTMYGLSNPAAANAKVWRKTTPTADWEGFTFSQINAAGADYGCLVEYKDFLYFWRSAYVCRISKDGSAGNSSTYRNIVWSNNIAQGVVHYADDILYLPYDNIIASFDGSNWDDTALTLPDKYQITSIIAFGNYLAIACRPKLGEGGNSVVYLWDKDSSLTTISESIDWGVGDLQVLNVVDGFLIGVANDNANTSFNNDDTAKMTIKAYSGGDFKTIFEYYTPQGLSDPVVFVEPKINFINDGKLYFSAYFWGDSATQLTGLFSLNRGRAGNFNVCVERIATDDNSETRLYSAAIAGDNTFFVHTNTENTLTRTTTSYTATSVAETQIIATENSSITKKLLGITVMTDPLPTAGQVVLKYKKDEESSWTTIFTNTTDNSISHSAINIESTGDTLSQYKEIQLRIESTGGAEPTGLKFKEEIVEKDIY